MIVCLAAALAAGSPIAGADPSGGDLAWNYVPTRLWGPFSVEDRLMQFGAEAKARLAPHFVAAGVMFPPDAVALLVFKDARLVELHARAAGQPWTFVHAYPVLAASGTPGPKLHEGDEQVPEGIYRVVRLNPNSRFHVSLRLDYPNEFDQRMAKAEGRHGLGGDIMIHGKDRSAGCLALGDEAAEDLFTLAALVAPGPFKVIISPTDFREAGFGMTPASGATWIPDLYQTIEHELATFQPGSWAGSATYAGGAD